MIHCPHCGYNLTGVCTPERPSGVCPECGKGFAYDELALAAAVEQRGLLIPILLLGAAPILFAVAMTVVFFGAAASTTGGDGWLAVLWVGVVVAALAALGTSIFTARRIARRLAFRPEGSAPNKNSVTLTIVFTLIFWLGQIALGFCLMFCGCFVAVAYGGF